MRLVDADKFDDAYIAIKEGSGFKADEEISQGDIAYFQALALDSLPTVDAVPVVHGEWVYGANNHHCWMKCSNCLVSQEENSVFSYCPNCGARMDGAGW